MHVFDHRDKSCHKRTSLRISFKRGSRRGATLYQERARCDPFWPIARHSTTPKRVPYATNFPRRRFRGRRRISHFPKRLPTYTSPRICQPGIRKISISRAQFSCKRLFSLRKAFLISILFSSTMIVSILPSVVVLRRLPSMANPISLIRFALQPRVLHLP